MKVVVKRGSQRHILFWRPLKGKRFYPINFNNVVFVGALEQIRAKINLLWAGKTASVTFEAYYCRLTKTLALWR